MTKRLGNLAAACSVAVMMFAAAPATAHAALVGASPAADTTVAAPDAIELKFSEGLATKFSGLELTMDGKKIGLAAAAFDAKNVAMTVAPKAPLEPGVYKVSWHAVASDDLHKTEGTFSFTVK